MKSIDLKMVSVEVKTETRPLRAQSAEMAKELNSFYSIDVESELESILAKIKKEERKSSIRKINGS
jgi:hypothetical protein